MSTLVILRRLLDGEWLTQERFEYAWAQEIARLQTHDQRRSGGGNFYNTTLTRVGYRFARALVESTLEGHTLYPDAFQMLGVKNSETFNQLGRRLGAIK